MKSHHNVQKVAQIRKIIFHDDKEEPTLVLQLYNRPEDIYKTEEEARKIHPNLLKQSDQKGILYQTIFTMCLTPNAIFKKSMAKSLGTT
jgi:hypothetical protein